MSIITACYDHGRYLPELFESIRGQDYGEIEWIIVDDASTEPATLAKLSELEREDRVTVLHQPENGGPSAARNRGITAAHGRYILPVDADNQLVPGAVKSLVEQIQAAGETVGLIYPTQQYFGNREYHFSPPEYNLHRLLEGNYIDTCSLLDREVFDGGLRYAEDIALGHEDWDLALALGARGVKGQPSRRTVMRYRKHGFTRSDRVEFLRLPFREEIQNRHPDLFGSNDDVGSFGRYAGPALRVKARWAPALSVIASETVDFASERGVALVRDLARQTCGDFELVAECPRAPASDDAVIRRLPPGLADSSADRIQDGIELSLGRFVLVTRAPGALMADPALVEKLMRGFVSNPELKAVAATDLGPGAGRFSWALIDQLDLQHEAHSLAWRREIAAEIGPVVDVFSDGVVEQLARLVQRHVHGMQWRHVPVGRPAPAASRAGGRRAVKLDLDRKAPRTSRAKSVSAEQQDRLSAKPAIPTMPPGRVPRWGGRHGWTPPETIPLVRHVEPDTLRRVITNDSTPPPGLRSEMNLGSIRQFSPPGTRRLIGRRDGSYLTVPRGAPAPDDEQPYGYLEEAPLPLFIGIERAVLRDGSQTLVVADGRDPLRAQAKSLSFLGYIEAYPVEPREQPSFTAPPTPVLLRSIDRDHRRHRYSVVNPPERPPYPGPIGAELGRLLMHETVGAIGVYIDDAGQVSTALYDPDTSAPAPRHVARWAAAPLGWRGFGSISGRVRSVARRGVDAERLLLRQAVTVARRSLPGAASSPAPTQRGRRVGYLLADPEPGMVALFAARHPVLDDQFLSHHALEATDMGYVEPRLLGFLVGEAPVTGTLGSHRAGIPWASRFGLAARQSF